MGKTVTILGITALLVVTLMVGVLVGGIIGGVASAQGPLGGPSGFGGMMGGGRGMMGGWGYSQSGTPITLDAAVASATRYVAAYNNQDLAVHEIMEFDNNFYVLVQEKSTGLGAFELLVDRYSGYVHPEPGPNMMWNIKYGHMGGGIPGGGMMGGFGRMMGSWRGGFFGGASAGPMTVTLAQARDAAQAYLNSALPGATLSESTATFYGYYTIDVKRDGKDYGMLSVNGYGGQVWYHSWHGAFIQEQELS